MNNIVDIKTQVHHLDLNQIYQLIRQEVDELLNSNVGIQFTTQSEEQKQIPAIDRPADESHQRSVSEFSEIQQDVLESLLMRKRNEKLTETQKRFILNTIESDSLTTKQTCERFFISHSCALNLQKLQRENKRLSLRKLDAKYSLRQL